MHVLKFALVVWVTTAMSSSAFPSDSDDYAGFIHQKCSESIGQKMDLSVRAVDRICKCVADTVLSELSISDINGTSGRSEKVRSSVNDAYKTCYLKVGSY